MLIEREQSALLLIDVQQRLLPVMSEPEQVLDNCAWLLRLAARLELPVLVSEQYPRGLGHTDPRLLELAPPDAVIEKLHFSCAAEPGFLKRIEALDRPQWVLGGIESHVCVLQTALGLHALGKEVYVVAEAVSSRRVSDKLLALDRLRQAGVRIVSREMVGFEWLHKAGDDLFREISREFLR
jgi:nicotinamidase-related amidase